MMKRLLFSIAFVLSALSIYAQAPTKFNYQAVARDAQGMLITSSSVSVRVSVLQGSASGTMVYEEEHSPTTNDFGLFSLQIGNGSNVTGDLNTIDWGSDSYFVSIEFDPEGGSDYSLMSASELVSVPYALHANTVENDMVNDADADSTNEIQTLALNGDTISISNGNAVVLDLPSSVELDGDSTNELITIAGLSGNVLEITEGGVMHMVDLSSLVNDADADSTNELQMLSIMNDTLYLSNGGSVYLGGYDQAADLSALNAELDADSAMLHGLISDNASDIADNASDIADNASDIADNASDIADNASDIADNASDIADNASDIADNASDIADNASDIADNASDIADNASDIADNASDIADNAGDIADNASDIADNASDIADNASDIADNASDIADNASDIADHIADDLDTDSTNELITSTALINDSILRIYEGVDSFDVDMYSLIDDGDWVRVDSNHIYSDDYVGIGIDTALFDLHVGGNVSLTDSLTVGYSYSNGWRMAVNGHQYGTGGTYRQEYTDMYLGSTSNTGDDVYLYGQNNYMGNSGSTSDYNYLNAQYNNLGSSSNSSDRTYINSEYNYIGSSSNYGYNYHYANYHYMYGSYLNNYTTYNYFSGYLGLGTSASSSYRLRVSGNEYHSGTAYNYGTYNYQYHTYNYLGSSSNSSDRNYLYARYNYFGTSNSYNYFYGSGTYFYNNYTYTRNLYPMYNNNSSYSNLGYYYNRWYRGYVTYFYRYYEYYLSDRRVKENIRSVESPLNKVLSLEGKIYDLNESHPVFDGREKSEVPVSHYKDQYGFIAQEVMEILPEMVEYDEEMDRYLIRNSEQLFPIIVEAMKEQQEMIDSQEATMEALLRRIEALENK